MKIGRLILILLMVLIIIKKVLTKTLCNLINGNKEKFSCDDNAYCCGDQCCLRLPHRVIKNWYLWLILFILFVLFFGDRWYFNICSYARSALRRRTARTARMARMARTAPASSSSNRRNVIAVYNRRRGGMRTNNYRHIMTHHRRMSILRSLGWNTRNTT